MIMEKKMEAAIWSLGFRAEGPYKVGTIGP